MAGLRLGPEGWHNSLVTITDWRKSSHSSSYNGCVEAGSWRKSSFCASNSCLEAGDWRTSTRSVGNGQCCGAASCRCHGVAVRDSQLGGCSPVLTSSAAAWEQFAGRVKADAGVAH